MRLRNGTLDLPGSERSVSVLSKFEPCLNCGASLGIRSLGAELFKLGFERAHVDVNCCANADGFALSIIDVSQLMEDFPLPLSIHLWPPYCRFEALPCRAEDIVFVHFQRELGTEIELARKVAGVGQVGLVVDRVELIPRVETVIMSERIRNVMALVIPIGSRGMPPAAWAEKGIRRLLEIRRGCDVRVTIDGGVNRCTIRGASVRDVDRVVVGGILFGKKPSFREIAKNIQSLKRFSQNH